MWYFFFSRITFLIQVKSKHIIPIEDQYFWNMCTAYEVCYDFTGKGSRTVKQPFIQPTTKVLRKGGALSPDLLYPYT